MPRDFDFETYVAERLKQRRSDVLVRKKDELARFRDDSSREFGKPGKSLAKEERERRFNAFAQEYDRIDEHAKTIAEGNLKRIVKIFVKRNREVSDELRSKLADLAIEEARVLAADIDYILEAAS